MLLGKFRLVQQIPHQLLRQGALLYHCGARIQNNGVAHIQLLGDGSRLLHDCLHAGANLLLLAGMQKQIELIRIGATEALLLPYHLPQQGCQLFQHLIRLCLAQNLVDVLELTDIHGNERIVAVLCQKILCTLRELFKIIGAGQPVVVGQLHKLFVAAPHGPPHIIQQAQAKQDDHSAEHIGRDQNGIDRAFAGIDRIGIAQIPAIHTKWLHINRLLLALQLNGKMQRLIIFHLLQRRLSHLLIHTGLTEKILRALRCQRSAFRGSNDAATLIHPHHIQLALRN